MPARKPAITGLPSGILDDIVKLGIKGVTQAVKTTKANKQGVKGLAPSVKKGIKNQGALSYKTNIRRGANSMGTKIKKGK
jgi:hypothetical protein